MQFNKYVRRRAREAGQTPISVKRLSKAARTRAAPVDKDEMYAYVKEEMAKVEARMLEYMTAFKSEMMGEMHTLGISMYAKWKEEMQTYSQKEMTAQLKVELVPLEGKIHAFMAKDMLKLLQEGLKAEGKAMKEACKQEVSTALENELQKSREAIAAMEESVSKVQENVEKKIHTWAEMAKDAVDKEVKECASWIEVVKKNKGMTSNQTEVMNATLEEEAKRKLYEDIVRFASMGDILLAGDFNARIGTEQETMYDTQNEMLRELDPCDLDMHRMAQDAGDVTDYGIHGEQVNSLDAHGESSCMVADMADLETDDASVVQSFLDAFTYEQSSELVVQESMLDRHVEWSCSRDAQRCESSIRQMAVTDDSVFRRVIYSTDGGDREHVDASSLDGQEMHVTDTPCQSEMPIARDIYVDACSVELARCNLQALEEKHRVSQHERDECKRKEEEAHLKCTQSLADLQNCQKRLELAEKDVQELKGLITQLDLTREELVEKLKMTMAERLMLEDQVASLEMELCRLAEENNIRNSEVGQLHTLLEALSKERDRIHTEVQYV
ncbi:hypothetical protein L7F22_064874 [Adiantum nelumboides]|nr:hypothetical protein [Adiantum nelumboides]